MFKTGNFAAEIATSMATHLNQKMIQKKASSDDASRIIKIASAVDHLNAAAELFDTMGYAIEAETITKILEKMAAEKHEDKNMPDAFEIESLLDEEPMDTKITTVRKDEDGLGEQVIEMRSIAKKKSLATTDNNSVKGDPFTEDLTPPDMVDNLLETGTPFDYKDVDFGKVVKLVQKHKHQPKDILHVLAPALTVGEDSNPDKNQIYIDKEKTFEDE